MSKIKFDKYLLLIVGVGLLVRLLGITHGFPFIFNIDEPAVVRSATGIRFNLNPGHFDWPHLHFYLNFFVFTGIYIFRGVIQTLGLKNLIAGSFPLLWRDPLVFYYASRVFDAVLGALTIIPIFLTAKKLFGYKTGLLAGLVLAFLPHHVWHSHFALVDVPMTFWFSWSLYFCSLILATPSYRNYILAGIFAGLSASTKYNGGFAIFLIIFATLLRGDYSKNALKKVVVAGVASLTFFFAGTPFALLDFKTFIGNESPSGAFWQFQNVGKVSSADYLPQLYKAAATRFLPDFGYTLLFLFFLSFGAFLLTRKKTKELYFIFIPSIFYFLYITSFLKNRIHYYMLVYPFLVVVCGLAFTKFGDVLNGKLRSTYLGLMLVVVVLLGPSVLEVASNTYQMLNKDTRVLTSEFLLTLSGEEPVFYSGNDLEQVIEDLDYKPKKMKSLLSILGKDGMPTYIVMSSDEPLDNRDSISILYPNYALLTKYSKGKDRMGPDVYIFKLKDNL